MCAKFQQKILNFVVVGACQSFQFFREIAWFLGNNRALSKFGYQILHNLISIPKLQKYHSIKANFNLTTWVTLSLSDSGAALWIWKKNWHQKSAVIYENYDSKM